MSFSLSTVQEKGLIWQSLCELQNIFGLSIIMIIIIILKNKD